MQTHETASDHHPHYWPRLALCLGALLLAFQLTACKDSSVVSDKSTSQPAASPVAASAAAPPASGTAVASPAPSSGLATPAPGAPVPAGTTTLTTANASIAAALQNATKSTGATPSVTPGTARRIGDFPMEVGPAKIPTPTPDPFKARPTPTVVMEGGKVKQQWSAPAEAASLTNPVKDRAEAVKLGRELYLQRCSDCHGSAGKGNGALSAQLKREGQPITPTNLASQMVQANTDGELFWKITNGKSPMPASRARFDDEQRWCIVAYLRTLK